MQHVTLAQCIDLAPHHYLIILTPTMKQPDFLECSTVSMFLSTNLSKCAVKKNNVVTVCILCRLCSVKLRTQNADTEAGRTQKKVSHFIRL